VDQHLIGEVSDRKTGDHRLLTHLSFADESQQANFPSTGAYYGTLLQHSFSLSRIRSGLPDVVPNRDLFQQDPDFEFLTVVGA
jgi:hypothetical protein